MTLELNLSPEVEAQLRADALAHRLPVEVMAAQRLSGHHNDKRAERLRALASLGTYDTRLRAGLAPTTGDDDDRGTFYDDEVVQGVKKRSDL